jgi:hypothetical protein
VNKLLVWLFGRLLAGLPIELFVAPPCGAGEMDDVYKEVSACQYDA